MTPLCDVAFDKIRVGDRVNSIAPYCITIAGNGVVTGTSRSGNDGLIFIELSSGKEITALHSLAWDIEYLEKA